MIEKINLQLINSLFETNEENSITLKSCLEEGDLLSEKLNFLYCLFEAMREISIEIRKCLEVKNLEFQKIHILSKKKFLKNLKR